MKNNLFKIALVSVLGLLLVGCSDKKPSTVFMPDMYYPVAYDPYQEAVLAYSDHQTDIPVFKQNSGATRLRPVPGTVARNADNVVPLSLPNTNEGYAFSKKIFKSPLNKANEEKDIARGKHLFEITCAVCHGSKGDGNGSIVESGAYSGVPDYKDRELTVGSVHYVIIHGKNAMGSYAGQLSPGDRWRVAMYVMSEFKSN